MAKFYSFKEAKHYATQQLKYGKSIGIVTNGKLMHENDSNTFQQVWWVLEMSVLSKLDIWMYDLFTYIDVIYVENSDMLMD